MKIRRRGKHAAPSPLAKTAARAGTVAAPAVVASALVLSGPQHALASTDTMPSISDTGSFRAISSSLGAALLAKAETMTGVPYVWGGLAPGGFDCSGLIYWAAGQLGIAIPRDTYEMLAGSPHLEAVSSPEPGDLAFFGTGHVELYVSAGRFFGAQQTGTLVGFHDYGTGYVPSAYYRLVGSYSAPAPQKPVTTVRTVTPVHGKEYTVRGGDCLSELAQRFYGQAGLWPKIWHANPQITDPNLIFAGELITIPA